MERNRFWEGLFCMLIAFFVLVVIWYPLTIPLKGFLPTPMAVAKDFFANFFISDTYYDIWVTMKRIALSFIGSLILGFSLGIWMGSRKSVQAFFLPWVVVALAIPGPVYIVMSILILGIHESSTIIALMIAVTPFVSNIIYQGVRAMDPKLNQMSRLYRVNPRQHLREVILPQIVPSILAAIRTGFALTWKEVVILEALSQPRGIGAQVLHFFKLLQTSQVIAWTFTFTAIMFLIEMGVFRQMEKRALRWKGTMQSP